MSPWEWYVLKGKEEREHAGVETKVSEDNV